MAKRAHVTSVREDDSEEIVENIKGNLEEDAKSGTSEEGEIPPKEEENLNKSSGEDEEMYLWDELEYKANYIRFISKIASAIVNKLEELVYDHRTRIKKRSRPLEKCNDNQPIPIF